MMLHTRSILVVAGLMAMAVGCQDQAGAASADVTLTLADVHARVATAIIDDSPRQELRVRCTVTADNRTGQALIVETSFLSPFDGLSLVAMDENGQELFRMPYTSHQSPHAFDQEGKPLPRGETTQTLDFPICPSTDRDKIAFKLVGGFPGTDFADGLESNTVVVPVELAGEYDLHPDPARMEQALLVIRGRLSRKFGGSKWDWSAVTVAAILKNDTEESIPATLRVAIYGWEPGIPEGECILYLEYYNGAEPSYGWRLLGGSGSTGVSQ